MAPFCAAGLVPCCVLGPAILMDVGYLGPSLVWDPLTPVSCTAWLSPRVLARRVRMRAYPQGAWTWCFQARQQWQMWGCPSVGAPAQFNHHCACTRAVSAPSTMAGCMVPAPGPWAGDHPQRQLQQGHPAHSWLLTSSPTAASLGWGKLQQIHPVSPGHCMRHTHAHSHCIEHLCTHMQCGAHTYTCSAHCKFMHTHACTLCYTDCAWGTHMHACYVLYTCTCCMGHTHAHTHCGTRVRTHAAWGIHTYAVHTVRAHTRV